MTRHQRYNRSEKGRARSARYRQTAKGQANDRRQHLLKDVRDREALINRNEEALTYPSTARRPRRPSPGTRSGVEWSTASTSPPPTLGHA